jgi:hypothetical protein
VKNKESGEMEQIGKAFRVPVKLGLRDRANHRIEILELLDKELLELYTAMFLVPGGRALKDKVLKLLDKEYLGRLDKALFVVTGGHGLQDKDAVKVEEKE